MGGIFLAEATVLRERKFFLHLFLVTLGVMRNTATSTTLELGHVVFDHSHTRVPLKSNKYKAFPLYVKKWFSSTLSNSAENRPTKSDYLGSILSR